MNRRNFLTTVGAAALTVVIPTPVPAKEMLGISDQMYRQFGYKPIKALSVSAYHRRVMQRLRHRHVRMVVHTTGNGKGELWFIDPEEGRGDVKTPKLFTLWGDRASKENRYGDSHITHHYLLAYTDKFKGYA